MKFRHQHQWQHRQQISFHIWARQDNRTAWLSGKTSNSLHPTSIQFSFYPFLRIDKICMYVYLSIVGLARSRTPCSGRSPYPQWSYDLPPLLSVKPCLDPLGFGPRPWLRRCAPRHERVVGHSLTTFNLRPSLLTLNLCYPMGTVCSCWTYRCLFRSNVLWRATLQPHGHVTCMVRVLGTIWVTGWSAAFWVSCPLDCQKDVPRWTGTTEATGFGSELRGVQWESYNVHVCVVETRLRQLIDLCLETKRGHAVDGDKL